MQLATRSVNGCIFLAPLNALSSAVAPAAVYSSANLVEVEGQHELDAGREGGRATHLSFVQAEQILAR